MEALRDYLVDFRRRAVPFANVDLALAKVQAEFDVSWAAGTFPGWGEDESAAAATTDQPPQELDLSQVGSAAELHAHGLDALKAALSARGLKSGGTLEQRAERLFSVKGLPREQWPKGVFAAPDKKKKKKAAKPAADVRREIAAVEAQVYHMATVLDQTIVRRPVSHSAVSCWRLTSLPPRVSVADTGERRATTSAVWHRDRAGRGRRGCRHGSG